MENKSFLGKFLFLLIIIVLVVVSIFFFMNKSEMDSDLENVEVITSMNADTFDVDMYVYKIDDEKIYTSEYFFNNYYLLNNNVSFDEFNISENTNFYLKNLSNTEKDIENIKVSYDKISKDEFLFLLNNYSLLKVNLWLDENDRVKNILLYSSNNIELELENY